MLVTPSRPSPQHAERSRDIMADPQSTRLPKTRRRWSHVLPRKPGASKPTITPDDDAWARFWSCVVAETTGCWRWVGSDKKCRWRYGLFWYQDENIQAHAFTYRAMVGEIAAGLEIDHQCNNTRCVNPSHLKPVTHLENVRRSESVGGINSRKSHCHRGHPFTPDNTAFEVGNRPDRIRRRCRQCKREGQRRRSDAA